MRFWRRGRQLAQDAPDIGQEAHVEHHVRLVEHEHLEVAQVDGTLLHVVKQTSGACNGHVDPAAQGLDLGAYADAAVDRGRCQACLRAEFADRAANLFGKLARWGKHECPQGAAPAGKQAMQNRQRVGGRLAGPGLGKAHHVESLHRRGNGLLLDRCWNLVATGLNARGNTRVQLKLGESQKKLLR